MNRKKNKKTHEQSSISTICSKSFPFLVFQEKKVLLIVYSRICTIFSGSSHTSSAPWEVWGKKKKKTCWEIPPPQRKKDLWWCSREYLRSVLVLHILLVHLRWPPWACGLVRGLSHVTNPRWCIWAHCHMCSNSCICATWLMHMCNVTRSYVRNDVFTALTPLSMWPGSWI